MEEMEDFSIYNGEGTVLRKAQLRMLDILIAFDDICKRHNIAYWLASGTLLGAVRHQGFIPWDDDIDVQVFQSDYNKLLKVLDSELPQYLILHTNKSDKNYKSFFAKIRDRNSFYEEVGSKNYKYKGLFIDIFPVEVIPSIRFKEICDSILVKYRYWDVTQPKSFKSLYPLLIFLKPLCHILISFTRLLHTFKKGKIYSYGYGIMFYYHHKYETLMPLKLIKFENHFFNAPNDIEAYLINNFGKDYMQLPPKDRRQTHATQILFNDI